MGKELFAGDYIRISLCLSTSRCMISEGFPHKTCPLGTPWKSGLPGEVHVHLQGQRCWHRKNRLGMEFNNYRSVPEVVHLTVIVE